LIISAERNLSIKTPKQPIRPITTMSSKLDQSLEEIAGSRRASTRRQRPAAKPRVSTGGVTKNATQKTAKPAKAAVAAPIPATGESKIIVSNLVCGFRHLYNVCFRTSF